MDSDPGQLPPDALSGDPAVFCDYLRRTGQAFVVPDGWQDQCVRVRFTGRFEAADVVWDCEFLTLQAELQRRGRAPRGDAETLRSFIEIGAAAAQGVPLRVGLDLARIDRPAILKMMTMIRNYKRLRIGRHEFGSFCSGADAGKPAG